MFGSVPTDRSASYIYSGVLHSFLSSNRAILIERCSEMLAARDQLLSVEQDSCGGIPVFIDQLIETLTIEQSAESVRSRLVSGSPGGGSPSEIGTAATVRSRELIKHGFTLEQVVRTYGDVCQAVTNLASETQAPIAVDEFRTLNRCLDNAIAGAVTEFSFHQAHAAVDEGLEAFNSRLGPLAHELRNHLQVAMHAVKAIKAGSVGLAGATGAVLDRSLIGMRNLIDRAVAEVRVTAGLPARIRVIQLAGFLDEVQAAASLDPRTRDISLTFTPVDADLVVHADPEMLAAALGNLLQNAFKFTQPHTEVTLQAYRTADRVCIEVQDHCGGLPPGPAESLLKPYAQNGDDRSGLGLGLDICRRSIEANLGTLRVRDLPGSGCIFTIDLPQAAPYRRSTNAC